MYFRNYHIIYFKIDERGGLKWPNPLWYYWAAQLRTLMFYYSEENVPLRGEMGGSTLQLPWSISKLLICK